MHISLKIYDREFDGKHGADLFEDAIIKVISDEHPEADLSVKRIPFDHGQSEIAVTLSSGPDPDEAKRLWAIAETEHGLETSDLF